MRNPLEGRKARCCTDESIRDSGQQLAFYVFRGLGSSYAVDGCVCGYYREAHEEGAAKHRAVQNAGCTGFTPRGPAEYDTYYCGHAGWD